MELRYADIMRTSLPRAVIAVACSLFLSLGLTACGDDDISSDEQARRAYLGLDQLRDIPDGTFPDRAGRLAARIDPDRCRDWLRPCRPTHPSNRRGGHAVAFARQQGARRQVPTDA